jgi:glycosyltransferase involved in cell wall biosynthesis
LPCLASDIRGNRDLIDPNGGLLFDQKSISSIADSIKSIMNLDSDKKRLLGEYNINKIKSFESNVINHQILDLYDS